MYIKLSLKRKWFFGKNKMKVVLDQEDITEAIRDWLSTKSIKLPDNYDIEILDDDGSSCCQLTAEAE